MANTVAHNTAFMTAAATIQKGISFAYFAVLARFLGVENIGIYTFVLTFSTIFVVFIDLGLSNLLVRELAKNREREKDLLPAILGFKSVTAILAYSTMILAAVILGEEKLVVGMIALSGLTMIFDSLHLTFYGVLRAYGNLAYEAFGMIMSQFLTLLLGGIFLFVGAPLYLFIVAFTLPSIINVLFSFSRARRVAKAARFWPSFRFSLLKPIFSEGWPFMVLSAGARIYSYADGILLSRFVGSSALGFYSVPSKLSFAFQFIPSALAASLYPRMSEASEKEPETLVKLLKEGLRYTILTSVPIAFGIAVLARPLIMLLAGKEFLPSVEPLQILVFGLIFSFQSFPLGAFLNATGQQAKQMCVVLFVLVFNLLGNFFLIPKFGPSGAAIMATLGNSLLVILPFVFVARTISFPFFEYFLFFLKTLLAGFGLALVAFWGYRILGLFPAIIFGMISYPLLILLLGAVKLSEVRAIYRRKLLRGNI